MDKNNPISYGLESPVDLYQKLIFEKERLFSDAKWSNYDFFNFHVTATHLFDDWLKEEKKTSKILTSRIKNTPKEMYAVLQILRDLTNGNKHRKLDKSSEEKRITSISDPVRNCWYSYFFSRFSIETDDFIFQVWDIAEITVDYFNWLFDSDELNTDFPIELKKTIHSKNKIQPNLS